MKIPIANIYYLLSYAWDRLEESKQVPVDADACDTPLELLARVLIGGTSYLFKKGLDRNYREFEDTIPAIKGKLLVGASIKSRAFHRSKAVCRFDVFDHDVLHNQILKTTLNHLCRVEDLDNRIRREARALFLRFHEVNEVVLTKSIFGQVHLHRNNRIYGFLLNVCELLYDNLLPDEQSGKYCFRDFLRDDGQMALLFEAFVRNFYKRELPSSFRVEREDILWQFSASDDFSMGLLPKMQTDITIRTLDRKIIIDTKFYKDALIGYYGSEKFRGEHIRQLYSYLKQQVSTDDPVTEEAEGILLYATSDYRLDHEYHFEGHQLVVRSVDLIKGWREVREELLSFI